MTLVKLKERFDWTFLRFFLHKQKEHLSFFKPLDINGLQLERISIFISSKQKQKEQDIGQKI
jgi:hypothetical protein